MFGFESSQSSSPYTFSMFFAEGGSISLERLDHLCVRQGLALAARDVELALWRLGGHEKWEIILSNIPGSPGPPRGVFSLSVSSWVEEVLQPPPYLSSLALGSNFPSPAPTNPDVCLQKTGRQAA